ncbi:MAG: dihydroneopterin aldolase [Alphaproteobacteria bacterium]|nr:dihydroneopterin aldolase [Alphaproteobacteria bacterium]
MTDRVLVSNLCVFGHHGVASAEKSLGQKFYIDICCEVDRPQDDSMGSAVDYANLCDMTAALSAKTTFNLIETFADRLAREIIAAHPPVRSVRVQIRKPSAPIRHSLDWVGVEVERNRDG